MGVVAARSGVAARERTVDDEDVDQVAKAKVIEVAHCLGEEDIPERSDGAARTGQDPPVQAGRRESTMEAPEGWEAETKWGTRRAVQQGGRKDIGRRQKAGSERGHRQRQAGGWTPWGRREDGERSGDAG